MNKNKFLQYFKWVWVIAVIGFIAFYFIQHLPEAIQYFSTVPTGSVLCSILLLFCARLLIILLALQSVKTGDWHPPYLQMFSIFSISQLGKYIPGGVWHFAARINSYKENSMTNAKVLQTMVIESVWMVSGSVAFVAIMFSIQHAMTGAVIIKSFQVPEILWKLLPWITIVAWIIGLAIIDRRYPVQDNLPKFIRIIFLILIQFSVWLALGGSFYLLFQSAGLENIWLVLGGYALSWVAGYVVPFAPGGIGIREAVQVIFFSPIATPEQIAIISIVHRMLYTITEVILGLIGFYLAKRYTPEKEAVPNETPGD
jgi:uncharacterized membrane protein YbhN (UPF0104 family)